MQNFEIYLAIAAGLAPAIFVTRTVLDMFFGRGAMSASLRAVSCAMCINVMPVFRRPTSLRQALFGGWTCKSCGTEMDRSGRVHMRRP